ncbi:MAG: hypothetical protein ACM3YE_02210 [Bacteroidota bacterium]
METDVGVTELYFGVAVISGVACICCRTREYGSDCFLKLSRIEEHTDFAHGDNPEPIVGNMPV